MNRKTLFALVSILLAVSFLTTGCQNNSHNSSEAGVASSIIAPSIQPTEEPEHVSTSDTPTESEIVLSTEEITDTKPTNTLEETASKSETEPLPVTSVRVVRGTSAVYNLVLKKSMSLALRDAESLPIFRLTSVEDARLLCDIFSEDRGKEDDPSFLTQGMTGYDESFFVDHELFIIYYYAGTSGYEENYFSVESLLRNQVLHLRVTLSRPNQFWDAGTAGYWIYVPMPRSMTEDLIAYDATMISIVYSPVPPDWTEPVNPDWRKME